MRISQWQWLMSSFERPNFSDPNSSAMGPAALAHQARARFQPAQRMLQLAMAHRSRAHHQRAVRNGIATSVVNSSAEANNGAAPTAERASRNATSYGFTTRSRVQPKLAIARAAAPMFNGFRGATSTTRSSPLEKKFAVAASRCIFLLTFFSNNLIYESHCDFRIAKFDV
jgi:hypothetical protein